MSKLQEEVARISFEMAKQAEIEGTVSQYVKGHGTLERQRPATPPRIVHPMNEMLDEIRGSLKLAWKSNLVDMNIDNYYENALAELVHDRYLRHYELAKDKPIVINQMVATHKQCLEIAFVGNAQYGNTKKYNLTKARPQN
uniref:Uncharacterized protein n=1 Tax=Romanomermis culicivorax TaxID=13658 RepID=A0A915HRM7_ROMCU